MNYLNEKSFDLSGPVMRTKNTSETLQGAEHIWEATILHLPLQSLFLAIFWIFLFRVGDNNRGHLDPEEKTYSVKKIIAHPNFKFYSMISDVALIELPAPVLFNNYVKPVCLPSTAGKVGEQCVISGKNVLMLWNASTHEKTLPVNDIWAIFSKLKISKNKKPYRSFLKREKKFRYYKWSLRKIT